MTEPAVPHEDGARFRHVLSHVPTSVVVVTGLDRDGTRAGMAIGSFTSISLDPQLVGFLPTHRSTSWPTIRAGGRFCVNVLAHGQGELARRFAATGGDKFVGLETRPAPVSGAPILDGVIAWLDCELDREIELGDHYLAVSRVLALEVERPAEPMVFCRGAYPRLES